MTGRLEGRTAVVTGAAQGIGLASARRLGQEGARVALVDLSSKAVADAADGLRGDGIDAGSWVADVSAEADVREAVAAIAQEFGRIDVLHSHAGILLPAAALDETVERWERTMAVNVRGMFLMTRAVIPSMQAQGGGAIVLTGSTAGIVAEPDFLGYCTSKAAVNHMARQLALQYAEDGIRVNAVCPGWVDTAFSDPILEGMSDQEVDDAVKDSVPMGRQGTAQEVAAVVAFLASDDASYVTGHGLVVDGGLTIA